MLKSRSIVNKRNFGSVEFETIYEKSLVKIYVSELK